MDIKNDLQDIFCDVFDDDSIVLTNETTAEDIEDWDSFAQIQLTVAIEKHFKVHFKLGEVGKMNNIGELIQAIEERMNA